MFEQEIQFYLTRGAALAEGRDSLTLAQIVSDPMLPQRIRTYFNAEAVRILREENAYRADSRFDHRSPEVRIIESQLDELLRLTARFTREEYAAILERAIKISFNFLCRPQLTLRSFVFRGQEKVSAETALARFAYFEDYQYLTYVLRKWIVKKRQDDGLNEVATGDFERIVRKIDDQMLESFTVGDLRSLLQPMFRWIADAHEEAQERIPADAFIMFFDDKNILRLSDQLAHLQPSKPTMDIGDVCRVIEEMLGESGSEQTPPAAKQSPSSATSNDSSLSGEVPFPFEAPIEPKAEASQEEILSTSSPETFMEEISSVSESKEESVYHPEEPMPPIPALYDAPADHKIDFGMMTGEAMETDDDADDVEDEEYKVIEPIVEPAVEQPRHAPPLTAEEPMVPSWDTEPLKTTVSPAQFSDRTSEFKIVGTNAAQPVLPDLRSLIGDDERKKFIKRLFRKNDPEYESALDAMNTMQTWKEASGYIDTLFLRNGVDPYAKHAIKFTDIVYSRFIKNPIAGRAY